MEKRKPKQASYIILPEDKINNLESYWGGVEFKLNTIDTKTKKEIKENLKNNINGIIGVLKKYTENKKIDEENKIQLYKELNEQLNEFNKYIKKINSTTQGFEKIKEVVEGFKIKYYDVFGIKENKKENNTAENGIGLFELFEVEKKIEETNEQSMESSSGTGTEINSGVSSDSSEMKEIKETKSKSSTTSTSSDSSENETKKEQVFERKINTATNKEMIDINIDNCFNYLKLNSFSKKSMEDIVLHENFKIYMFENTKIREVYNYSTIKKVINGNAFENNLLFLYFCIFKPILSKYENEKDIDINKKYEFINNAFDVLISGLTKIKNDIVKPQTGKLVYVDQNGTEYEIENNMFSDLIQIITNSKDELLGRTQKMKKQKKIKSKKQTKKVKSIMAQQTLAKTKTKYINNLIEAEDLNTCKNNETLITKTIDKNLNKYITKEDKQQTIQNTIDLIKNQKLQLQNNKEKLEKATILLIFLEVYRVNIDKFNSVNEVYKMLNNTVKKKIKNINLTETSADLAEVIKEVNGVLGKKSKSSIDTNNVTITF